MYSYHCAFGPAICFGAEVHVFYLLTRTDVASVILKDDPNSAVA